MFPYLIRTHDDEFGFRAANYFNTDIHKSLARLRMYVPPMHFSISLQTVSSLKSHTCLD